MTSALQELLDQAAHQKLCYETFWYGVEQVRLMCDRPLGHPGTHAELLNRTGRPNRFWVGVELTSITQLRQLPHGAVFLDADGSAMQVWKPTDSQVHDIRVAYDKVDWRLFRRRSEYPMTVVYLPMDS